MPKSVNSDREDSIILPSEQWLRDHKKFIGSFSFRLKLSALEKNENGGRDPVKGIFPAQPFELGFQTKPIFARKWLTERE